MLFSEAVRKGSLDVVPYRGVVLMDTHGVKYGCAIGMAYVGSGRRATHDIHGQITFDIAWKWIDTLLVDHPCDCNLRRKSFLTVVAHLFDNHVMYYDYDYHPDRVWSLNQLIHWIEEQERIHGITDDGQIKTERTAPAPDSTIAVASTSECSVTGELGQGDLSIDWEGFLASLDPASLETEIQGKSGIYSPGDSSILSGTPSKEVLEEPTLVGV